MLTGLAQLLVVWIFMMGAAPSDHVEVRNWSSSAIDAWFDVMTALSGSDRSTALIFAGIAEIPLAGLLGTLAVTSTRRHGHGR